MPHLRIETNLSKDRIPPDFLKNTVDLLATLLGKPKTYCVVSIHPDTMMVWGDTDDICGIVRLLSLGGLGPNIDESIASTLHTHFNNHLGIKPDRLYIHYIDEKVENLSHKGMSFKKLFG